MQIKLIILSVCALASAITLPSLATEGGVNLDWKKHSYLVESNCTGTILAGRFMLTAGHCGDGVKNPFPRTVNLATGENIMPTHRNAEPYYNIGNVYGTGGADVALWTLPSTIPVYNTVFFANLIDSSTRLNISDVVTFTGFGRDNKIPKLGRATNTVTLTHNDYYTYDDSIEHSVPGDSGAPVFNSKGVIVALNHSSTGSVDPATGTFSQTGSSLHLIKNWLLTSIDRWHAATELKFTGTKTIEIQSLHVNDVDMSLRQNAGTLTTGDVTVTGGTCVTNGAISPFGMCTLELNSGAGEGKILLENDNEITVNRAPKVTPKPAPAPNANKSSGSSGGSVGFAGLLALLVLSLRRKYA